VTAAGASAPALFWPTIFDASYFSSGASGRGRERTGWVETLQSPLIHAYKYMSDDDSSLPLATESRKVSNEKDT
jgi:hypothetical protein